MQASTLIITLSTNVCTAIFAVAITLCIYHPRQPLEGSAPTVSDVATSEPAPVPAEATPTQAAPIILPQRDLPPVALAETKEAQPKTTISAEDLQAMAAEGRKKADATIERVSSAIATAKSRIASATTQVDKAEKIKALSSAVGFVNDLADSGTSALDKLNTQYVERINQANKDYAKTLAVFENKLGSGVSDKKISQKALAAYEQYSGSLDDYLAEADKAVAKLAALYGK
jgi:hypothetical protein